MLLCSYAMFFDITFTLLYSYALELLRFREAGIEVAVKVNLVKV